MAEHGLSTGGLLFLALAWGFIILLNVYCFVQLFRERKEEIVDPLTNPEKDKQP